MTIAANEKQIIELRQRDAQLTSSCDSYLRAIQALVHTKQKLESDKFYSVIRHAMSIRSRDTLIKKQKVELVQGIERLQQLFLKQLQSEEQLAKMAALIAKLKQQKGKVNT